jgi:hypothetical protein
MGPLLRDGSAVKRPVLVNGAPEAWEDDTHSHTYYSCTDILTRSVDFYFIFIKLVLPNFVISKLVISLVPSLQLPYGLGRDEGREPIVPRNTILPSCTASWHCSIWKPAAPMCQRKHRTAGDRSQCAYARHNTRSR